MEPSAPSRRSSARDGHGKGGAVTETLWPHSVSVEDAAAITVRLTDAVLGRLLAAPPGLEARVYEAMRYSALSPGKRLRPLLVLASAQLFGVARRSALQVAAAIEMVHAYSLIHDDLPAMDDSDLRRGRPTSHKQFDEATAVLAGGGRGGRHGRRPDDRSDRREAAARYRRDHPSAAHEDRRADRVLLRGRRDPCQGRPRIA